MQTSNKPMNRNTKINKNFQEKGQYKNFLNKRMRFDGTLGEKEDLLKTDSSNYENDDDVIEKSPRVKGRSWKLKFADFVSNNWGVSLISGVCILLISALFYFVFLIGGSLEKINNMEKSLGEVNNNVTKNTEDIQTIKSNSEVMSASINKDIEYLKNLIFRNR